MHRHFLFFFFFIRILSSVGFIVHCFISCHISVSVYMTKAKHTPTHVLTVIRSKFKFCINHVILLFVIVCWCRVVAHTCCFQLMWIYLSLSMFAFVCRLQCSSCAVEVFVTEASRIIALYNSILERIRVSNINNQCCTPLSTTKTMTTIDTWNRIELYIS